MKSNKGFTLIELLAVIVILAIIALIATPVILGIIEDARAGAKENSAKLIISSVEKAYANAYMLNEGRVPTVDNVKAKFNADMDGAKWNDDNTITSDDQVYCTVTTTGNVLAVDCKASSESGAESYASTSTTMKLATN